MFRPVPEYLVSSLALSQSYLSVGSSERNAVLAFPRPAATRGVAVEAEDEAAGAAAVEPPETNIQRTTSTSAITPRAMARMSLFRFSAPTCTLCTRLQISFQLQLQLDHPGLLAAQVHAVDNKEQRIALHGIHEANQLQIITREIRLNLNRLQVCRGRIL